MLWTGIFWTDWTGRDMKSSITEHDFGLQRARYGMLQCVRCGVRGVDNVMQRCGYEKKEARLYLCSGFSYFSFGISLHPTPTSEDICLGIRCLPFAASFSSLTSSTAQPTPQPRTQTQNEVALSLAPPPSGFPISSHPPQPRTHPGTHPIHSLTRFHSAGLGHSASPETKRKVTPSPKGRMNDHERGRTLPPTSEIRTQVHPFATPPPIRPSGFNRPVACCGHREPCFSSRTNERIQKQKRKKIPTRTGWLSYRGIYG
ncbi:hypothetical protein BKA64DRAFT_239275 [Cadophora sp. MPI-SDFR-AT-0126]|nr:hypothetical protein BKA64DRAFT_239275 [Leotiomycetes sp. MPI-SDFR-AT-0126]